MSAATETASSHQQDEADVKAQLQAEQSKFIQHLANYPALTAVAGLIASFPVAKIFVSNAVPLLHAIHERSKPVADPLSETAAPYLRSLDNVGDKALNHVDARFPQLQTVHPSDVYEGAQNYIGSIRGNAKAAYDARVGKPLSSAAQAAKNQYVSIYDSRVGTYVAPLNDRLESAIDQYLPADGENVPELEPSDNSQVRRTYSLARLAAERAAPKLKGVYDKQLEKQANGAESPNYLQKLLALLATGRFLSLESYNFVLGHFGTPEKLQQAVGEFKAKNANYVEQAENAAAELAEEAQNN